MSDYPDASSTTNLDADHESDANIRFEHLFETVLGSYSSEGHNADGTESDGGQIPRLTLLEGGVTHRPSVPVGVPVSTIQQSHPVQFSPLYQGVRHEPPAMRYKRPPAEPPLWSATADWNQLTHQRVITTELPTANWTSEWTLTYRHGKNTHTTTVASVSPGDLLAADPIRVNSWHKKKTSRAGLRYMNSTDELHAHESLFERKLLRVLDFDGATAVSSQPFTLTWHDGTRNRHHTPDFVADIDGQLTVINTRPEPLVKPRLVEDAQAIAALCASRGWNQALVVGYPLPAFTVIETVGAHANANDHLGYGENILETVSEEGPVPFGDLANRFDSPVLARAVIQRLIWQREVSVDLAMSLEDTTLVALPGQEVRP